MWERVGMNWEGADKSKTSPEVTASSLPTKLVSTEIKK